MTTTNTLTLDTTDHSTVRCGVDGHRFQRRDGRYLRDFPRRYTGSVFGTGTSGNPLLLTGSSNQGAADQVSLWGASDTVYYFNTGAGHWETTGSSANANNTIIYPYSALSVYRHSGSNAMLMLTGQVTPTNACGTAATRAWR